METASELSLDIWLLRSSSSVNGRVRGESLRIITLAEPSSAAAAAIFLRVLLAAAVPLLLFAAARGILPGFLCSSSSQIPGLALPNAGSELQNPAAGDEVE